VAFKVSEIGIDEMKRAVEHMHRGVATFAKSVSVHEALGEKTIWQGKVHIFRLEGVAAAKQAYAWAHDHSNGKRRYFAVLHKRPITTAAHAVRAAIIEEQRTGSH
jgi:hypothetical protein